jgi:hypothetical protein
MKRYNEVDWTDEKAAIQGFKGQLDDFYVSPTRRLLEHRDGLFMAVALTCVLIDTVSQYEAGARHATRTLFMSWLKNYVPGSKQRLPVAIEHTMQNGEVREIQDFAAAVYYGYRCGILHEAHPYMYCGIAGQYRAICEQEFIFSFHPTGLTQYDDGTDCPTVVVDPPRLLDAVVERLNEYFHQLQADSSDGRILIAKFKNKFLWSHGISIGTDI